MKQDSNDNLRGAYAPHCAALNSADAKTRILFFNQTFIEVNRVNTGKYRTWAHPKYEKSILMVLAFLDEQGITEEDWQDYLQAQYTLGKGIPYLGRLKTPQAVENFRKTSHTPTATYRTPMDKQVATTYEYLTQTVQIYQAVHPNRFTDLPSYRKWFWSFLCFQLSYPGHNIHSFMLEVHPELRQFLKKTTLSPCLKNWVQTWVEEKKSYPKSLEKLCLTARLNPHYYILLDKSHTFVVPSPTNTPME